MNEEIKPTIKLAKITVTYEQFSGGRGSNDFNNLQELKRWLDSHKEIAEKLGYIKK